MNNLKGDILTMTNQDAARAAHLIDGYLLRLSMPKKSLRVDFDAARKECVDALTAQLDHVKSLPFEKFCAKTNRTTQAQLDDAAAQVEVRLHQCIKDAWKYVNKPGVSDSAKSTVVAVANSPIGTCSRVQLKFALETARPFIFDCGDMRLIEESTTLTHHDFNQAVVPPPTPARKDEDAEPHPGGYYVMINGDAPAVVCERKPTLAEARLAGQALCDAAELPATFSIYDGDDNLVADILRTDGRDLSAEMDILAAAQAHSEPPRG